MILKSELLPYQYFFLSHQSNKTLILKGCRIEPKFCGEIKDKI